MYLVDEELTGTQYASHPTAFLDELFHWFLRIGIE
jgi:hypothetical protein